MFGVAGVYLGLMGVFVGGVSLLRPLSFLAIRTRRQAALFLALGFIVVVVGGSLPAGETRVSTPRTQLDQFAPVYQFGEFHSIRIAARKEQVYRALKLVTADEIAWFRTLTWLRRLGRPGPESILNPPSRVPLLDVAAKTSFLVLAEEPDSEIVLGTLVAAPRGWRPSGKPTPDGFKALFVTHPPGFAPATMNFRIEEAGPTTCRLTTETRVYATDAATRRRFALYWRVIYPGSALIRGMWLAAIARRAESR
ncbi:MAG TPA: hypothetical protein VH110_09185 [Candidatus Acidoferrum sp.]|jgi:hypothetical protein|nr:hypothetical protein [Candidatus Acidoferrum sp.]